MIENQEKNCKNCGYYLPHYVKSRAYLLEVDGHCRNIAYKNRRKEAWETCKACRHWKPQGNEKAERRKSIQESLRNMEKSLEDIRLILQSDDD